MDILNPEAANLNNNNNQNHIVEQGLVTDYEIPGMKHILKNCSGFALPGEILGIIGPSGSGKTSLLNILSSRQRLSLRSKFTGKIEANLRSLGREEFAKIGAFVQQDDILLMTFTPYEHFKFAARLKTNCNEQQIEELVQSIIRRLRL